MLLTQIQKMKLLTVSKSPEFKNERKTKKRRRRPSS